MIFYQSLLLSTTVLNDTITFELKRTIIAIIVWKQGAEFIKAFCFIVSFQNVASSIGGSQIFSD